MIPISQTICATYQITSLNSNSFSFIRKENSIYLKTLLTTISHQNHFNFIDKSKNNYFVFEKDQCFIIRKYNSSGYKAILICKEKDHLIIYKPLSETSEHIKSLVENLFDCLEKQKGISYSNSLSSSSSSSTSSSFSPHLDQMKSQKKVVISNWGKIENDLWISIFMWSNLQGYSCLSIVNKYFNKIMKKTEVITALFNYDQIPPKKFLDLINLVQLDHLNKLNFSRLSNINFDEMKRIVAKCLNLQQVNLSLQERTSEEWGVIFDNLSKGIKSIYLVDCGIREVIEKIPRKVEYLDMSHCGLMDEDLKKLPKNLTSLNLSWSHRISDEGLKYLSKQLLSLCLDNCYLITDAGLENLSRELKFLSLYNCRKITSEGIRRLPPRLVFLNLENTEITDEAVESFPSTLTSLNLNFTLITDIALERLPISLTFLGLRACYFIKSQGVIKLFQRCKNLTSLNLALCCTITDTIIENLPKTVTSLDISGCGRITDKGLRIISKYLKIIELGQINHPKIVEELHRRLPDCVIKYRVSKKKKFCLIS